MPVALALHSCPVVSWWPRPLLDTALGCDSVALTGPMALSKLAPLHTAGREAHSKGLGSRGTPSARGHGGSDRGSSAHFWDTGTERTRQKAAVMSHSYNVTQQPCHTIDPGHCQHTGTAAGALGTATSTAEHGETQGTPWMRDPIAQAWPDSPPSLWLCHNPWSLPGFPGLPLISSHNPELARAPKTLRQRASSQTSMGWVTKSLWKIRNLSHCQSCYPSSGAARTRPIALDSHKCVGCFYLPG